MESSQLKDRNHLFCRERFSLSISMHTSGYEAYLAVSVILFYYNTVGKKYVILPKGGNLNYIKDYKRQVNALL